MYGWVDLKIYFRISKKLTKGNPDAIEVRLSTWGLTRYYQLFLLSLLI